MNDKLNSIEVNEVQRAKSPLIRILQTPADRYKRNIESSHSKVKKYRYELVQIMRELDQLAAVKYAGNIPSACPLETDKISSDVIITASELSRTERDTAMAKAIVIEKPIDTITVFHLNGKIVQRPA